MKENLYKRLPPLERRPDGILYHMTPEQRKQANSLIRQECCNCEGGDCIALDDGDSHTCPQMISFSFCCKWFRWAVLPLDGTLEAEIFRDKDLKRCAVCGGVFIPKSNRSKYCPGAPPEFTGGRKQKVNGKGSLLWTVRQEKSLDLQGFASPKQGHIKYYLPRKMGF